jgi:hypothetical protein
MDEEAPYPTGLDAVTFIIAFREILFYGEIDGRSGVAPSATPDEPGHEPARGSDS